MDTKNILIEGMPAHHAYPADGRKHPGLIVIHEIWGLDNHIQDVTQRFAKEGYSVLAPDLFHDVAFEGKIDHTILEEMADPLKRDEAQKKMRALLAPIQAPEFAQKTIEELKRSVSYLLQDEGVNGHVGVLGFCFGGTYSFSLAAADTHIEAAVPFYGHPPEPLEKISSINCPVLAFYGEEDAALMASLPALKEAMQEYGKDFTAVVYPNAGHAFFNDTNARMYRADAAKDAWQKTLAFLQDKLPS